MESTYGHAVGLAIPIFFALIGIELLLDRFRGTKQYRLADSLNSLSCGIFSTGMRIFFGFLGLFMYERVLAHAAPVRLPAEHWGTWVFALFLYDFCYYWQHRLSHTVGFFWASHVVHHQSEEFNLTTALRQPGTGSLINWIFYLPMALAGIPVPVFLLVGVIQLFYQFWPHTQAIGRLGFLDRWIQTPSNHRVHHAQNDRYLDRNYVGMFLIWDRLFGTFQDELDEDPPIYGIRGQLSSWNPLWANVHYYWAMARDCWYAHSWRDKLYVWIAPPGWHPADVAARFPKNAYDPLTDFVRFDPPRSAALSWYALLQLAALVVGDQQFLTRLPHQPLAVNVLCFVLIVAGLVTIGGMLENRREFLLWEAVRLAATSAGMALLGFWPAALFCFFSIPAALAVHRKPAPEPMRQAA
jgi:alkylglycerol monooxygenase